MEFGYRDLVLAICFGVPWIMTCLRLNKIDAMFFRIEKLVGDFCWHRDRTDERLKRHSDRLAANADRLDAIISMINSQERET